MNTVCVNLYVHMLNLYNVYFQELSLLILQSLVPKLKQRVSSF